MESYEDNLKTALENAIMRERTARRRSIIYTFIPMLMAAILIAVTLSQVSSARKDLAYTQYQLVTARTQLQTTNSQLTQAQGQFDTLQDQLKQAQTDITNLTTQLGQYKQETEQLRAERDALQKQVDDLQKTINELGQQVDQAQSLNRYLYKGNLTLGIKEFPGDPQYKILLEILDLQSKHQAIWHLGGIGPQQFDSPGFAVYMLNKYGALPGDIEKNHYALIKILPPTNNPTNGDIVFYEEGYTMFYYFDESANRPFVIGMTPLGIVALNYDFASIRMIGHVDYPSQ
jgi:hypothetical protein